MVMQRRASLDAGSEISFGDESLLRDGDLHSGATERAAVREVKALATRETVGVWVCKATVLFLMSAIATLVSAGAFRILLSEQNDDYLETYELFIKSMTISIQDQSTSLFTAMRSVSKIVSSDAATRNSTFPFHTVANFEVIGEAIRKDSGVETFAFAPLVNRSNYYDWIEYATTHGKEWLQISHQAVLEARQEALRTTTTDSSTNSSPILAQADFRIGDLVPYIYDLGGPNGTQRVAPFPRVLPYAPLWQASPPPLEAQSINLDFQFFSFASRGLEVLRQERGGILTGLLPEGSVNVFDHSRSPASFVSWETMINRGDTFSFNPHSVFMEPVFVNAYNVRSDIVGYIVAFVGWDRYVSNLLPEGVDGIVLVIRNTCGQSLTYEIDGKTARFVDRGDLHDVAYNSTQRVVHFGLMVDNETMFTDLRTIDGECKYAFHIYSSAKFENRFESKLPEILTAVVASSFCFLIAAFFLYDWFVARRNLKVINLAARANELISSLFPSAVRDRFLRERHEQQNWNFRPSGIISRAVPAENSQQIKETAVPAEQQAQMPDKSSFLDDEDDSFMYKTAPIADLYAATTILFADIAGFTAWSSVRDPTQVFTLLETLYKSFDAIAKRRRVFKVETIGDCYVAVSGLPEPTDAHAVIISRFAYECLRRMRQLTRKLESLLGPDTADLDMRFGLHSGPVTAGVLRGERSRFQLFGDTVNTASRMESTGQAGKIHVSQDTADLLRAAGKAHWVTQRDETVMAKGKGELVTYWVKPLSQRKKVSMAGSYHSSFSTDTTAESDIDDEHDGEHCFHGLTPSTSRMVRWNVEIMMKILKEVDKARLCQTLYGSNTNVDAEIKEDEDFSFEMNANEIRHELEDFMITVASMFPSENRYHDYAHASHVAMTMVKLWSSLRSPDSEDAYADPAVILLSDPLSQFACVLACMVCDVAHPGVPNRVLIQQRASLALAYGNKNVAENNSLDLAWKLLMDKRYVQLRVAIYGTCPEEKERFHDIFRNCVLATDMEDEAMHLKRETRWNDAFLAPPPEESLQDVGERKAVLLLEYMMQVSVWAHTMQHWDIFEKWGTRLFEEQYQSFSSGRAPDDPSATWFEDVLLFYDQHLIPLATKLQASDAFHAAVVEPYLTYAKSNREEWEARGRQLMLNMTTQMLAYSLNPKSKPSSYADLNDLIMLQQ